jgi:hypothetical protein
MLGLSTTSGSRSNPNRIKLVLKRRKQKSPSLVKQGGLYDWIEHNPWFMRLGITPIRSMLLLNQLVLLYKLACFRIEI